MYKIYGIPNCNTVKKALNSLEQSGKEFEFINFKKQPPTKDQILHWKEAFGDWPANRKGPTFRKIKDEFESATPAKKSTILIDNSSAIKRPILMKGSKVIAFGFDEETYATIK